MNKPELGTNVPTEHPAQAFAREIGARSVVLPTNPQRPRNLYEKPDVQLTWYRHGWKGEPF